MFKNYKTIDNIIMGSCAVGKERFKKDESYQLDKFDKEPEDTQEFMNKTLPSLELYALLKKVKIKNAPQKAFSVNFAIQEIEELTLPAKMPDLNQKIKWEIEQNFQFSLTEYELRKRFLKVVVSSEEAVVSTLSINLYLISVGPYHIDFKLFSISEVDCRISFDFKISQAVNMVIEPIKIELSETNDFIGDKYAFSLKTIIGNNPVTSSISNVCEVDNISENTQSNVTWEADSNGQNNLPQIAGRFPFYQFHYASLKLIFWRIDEVNKTHPEVIAAESFISFVKLLSFDSIIIERGNLSYELKNVELNEKLWLNGKECGKAHIKLKFEIQKHLKQMLVCVRTERGITKTSPVFQETHKKKFLVPEIMELQTLTEKIIQEETEVQKLRVKKQKDSSKLIKEREKKMEKYMEQELVLLDKTSKQTIKFYTYGSQEELLIGQSFLLDIGNRTLRFVNEDNEITDSMKWKLLTALMYRGQFYLNYIGFDLTKNSPEDAFIIKKKKFSIGYQEFLYKLLDQTVKILGMSGHTDTKQFAQFFCALSYFRIPQFRQKLLSLIQRDDDPIITQWRGTDFSLYGQNEFKTYLPGENTFQIFFDWDKYFYSQIQHQKHYDSNIEKLNEVFTHTEWEKRFSKRSGAFFAFIQRWVEIVNRVCVRIVHSNWKHFPGYIQLIRCFMAEMKIRPIREYPSSIKLACASLLSNENLLNTFITIIFNKTNINNSYDVLKIMDMTSSFFEAIKSQNKRIPTTFNYSFFFQGLKMVIENMFSYTTAKALSIFYDHFDFFSQEFKVEISNYLLGRIFFKLFCHWSYNVRIIFHHVMVIRIYMFFTNAMKEESQHPLREEIREISKRYSMLLIVLENVSKMKAKQYIPSTEDQLYKKLKNNLRKKKKRLRSNGENENNLWKKMPGQFTESESTIGMKQDYTQMMEELARPKLERYDSQILTKDIQIAFENNPMKSTKDEVIRKKGTLHLIKSQEPNIEETIPIRRKVSVSLNSAEQIAMPVISLEDSKYITQAMSEFNNTSNIYLKNLKQMKGAPILKMEIVLDSSQMRPENYSSVEQW